MTVNSFPHLTDVESVRQEASDQYGGLSDAMALQQAHAAAQDPNVHAVALKRVNPEATLDFDHDDVQSLIDDEYGEGYTVLDYAVRGDGLSVVAEDASGRPIHLVTAANDRYQPVALRPEVAAERAHAEAEAARSRLGAEARAEIERRVREATAEIMAKVHSALGAKQEQIDEEREQALQEAAADAEGTGDDGGDDSGEVHYPGQHDALDELAKANQFEWPDDVKKVPEKQKALADAGIKPPAEE